MMTAYRSHRHFNLPRKGFDLDKYLDEQLAASPGTVALSEGDRVMHFHGTLTPEQLTRIHELTPAKLTTAQQFRGWAIRLNDRCEDLLDSVDWKRVDIWFGSVCSVALTGAILYLGYVVLDAWLQGRLNLGAN